MTRPLSLNTPHFNSSSLTVLSKILPAFGILCLLFLLPGLDAFIDFNVDGWFVLIIQGSVQMSPPQAISDLQLCHSAITISLPFYSIYLKLCSVCLLFYCFFSFRMYLENKDYLFTIDQFLMHSQHSRLLLKVHTEKNLPLHFSCVWPWASNFVSMSQISIDDHNFLYCPQMRYP